MGNPVKIHERSFNRGVNDVLTLEPLREAFAMLIGVMPKSAARAGRKGAFKGVTTVARANSTRQR